jgi:hypothetical protein
VETGLFVGGYAVLHSLMGVVLRKGVVWFFLATIAEVPPTVCSSGFLAPLSSSPPYPPGADFVKFKW